MGSRITTWLYYYVVTVGMGLMWPVLKGTVVIAHACWLEYREACQKDLPPSQMKKVGPFGR
eukprot:2097326-Rhodomonas_salina.1